MKTLFVLFAFGIVFCYGSTVNIYARNLANIQVAKPTFAVTQGAQYLNQTGSVTGLATFNLPNDDVWTLNIVKSNFLTFDSPFNFTNSPASIIIPMTAALNSTTRYRWMLNWVDATAGYDLQLFTPSSCVVNTTSTCGGKFSVASASTTGPNYLDLGNDVSFNGFYRLGAAFTTYDSRALIQVVNSTAITNYIFQSGASSTSSAGFWHVADYLICSWGSEITYFNEIITQSFTYPWAYDYCLYQPITITGNVKSNVTNINNVTITFIDTTGAYPNVTVYTGAAASTYSANLRTTTYRVLVSQSGYYSYDNTTIITSASTTFDVILNLIPTTTTTTTSTTTSTSTSTSTSSGTSSSTSSASGATSSGTTSSSSSASSTGTSTSGTTAAGTTTTGTVTTGDNNSTTDASTSVATTGTTGSTTAGESSASTIVASVLAVVVAAIVIVL